MPVAAGESEIVRAADALASLAAYEPEVGVVALVDDERTERDLGAACVPAPLRERTIVLRNPREGRDTGLHGGTCAATLAGLRILHERGSAPLIVRLDADALVIGPFGDAVAAALAARPDIGIVGSYTHAPTGLERDFGDWEHRVRKLTRPV